MIDLSSITSDLLHRSVMFPHRLPSQSGFAFSRHFQINMNQDDNVVVRLRRRLDDARAAGFKVRFESLDEEQPGWCQVGNSRFLFVNLSQTAAEQLAQIDETLRDFTASAKLADKSESPQSVNRAA